MKELMILFASLVLAGCVSQPEIRLSADERSDCIKASDPKSDLIIISSFDQGCLEYGRRERFKGVWYLGFEESGFDKGARHARLARDLERDDNPEFGIWLTSTDLADLTKFDIPEDKAGCARAIHVDFEGRRAVRRVPPPMQRKVAVISIEHVSDAKFIGFVATTRGGKPYRDCSENPAPKG